MINFENVYKRLETFRPKALVSACLVGLACRYDGQSKADPKLQAQFEEGLLVPICPEVQGGLSIPRPPCGLSGSGEEVWQGKAQVLRLEDGQDMSEAFKCGAEKALDVAKRFKIRKAILKQHSPSCGCGSVGGANGERIKGNGVTCALLLKNGIKVQTVD